jgi:hypothetical protein
MTHEDPFETFDLGTRLQLVVFELELAHAPRSLIAAAWKAFDRFQAMTWKPSADTDRVHYESERQV